MTALPFGGRAVLTNVAEKRSPWHGWEGNSAANTSEGQEAYAVRAKAITACREAGLLTPENLLTKAGMAGVRVLQGDQTDPLVSILVNQDLAALARAFPTPAGTGGTR